MKKILFPVALAALFILTGSFVFADDCAPCAEKTAKGKVSAPKDSVDSNNTVYSDCAPCGCDPCGYSFFGCGSCDNDCGSCCPPCCFTVRKHHRYGHCNRWSSCCPTPCQPACAPCCPAPCQPACAPCCPPAPCQPVCAPCCNPCDNDCGWNSCGYKSYRVKKCHHRAKRAYRYYNSCCSPCC